MSLITVKGKAQQSIIIGEERTAILAPMESIISMYAISNLGLIGPTFDMLVLDAGGSILNPMPQQGTPIEIQMGDSRTDANKMTFRCVGSPVVVTTQRGPAIRISATLDRPKLFDGICRKSFTGTSSSVIKEIGTELGLYIGDRVDSSVGDSMKWLPMSRKYGQFLADIALHGWFGDDSAASVVGVTLDGELVYRDLAKISKQKATHRFFFGVDLPPGDADAYLVHSRAYEDLSSVGIAQQGYTASRSRWKLDGTLETSNEINVTQNNERLNISEKMKAEIGMSRISLGAPDCGNTHDNYDKAYYQNMRYRSTFGRQIAVAVAQATSGIDIGDPTIFYEVDPKTRTPTATFGIITSKTRAIVNGFYVERFNIGYQGEDNSVLNG